MSSENDKVAVVTGGANGIGSAIVRRLGEDGFAVALVDKDEKAAVELAGHMGEAGFIVRPYVCDLTAPEQIGRTFDDILRDFGQVDVLVNNAGVGGYLDWRSMSLDEWHRFTEVNCDAAFLCMRRAAQDMASRREPGSIILILSQAALNQDVDIVLPYGTSKWCERGLMLSAARDLSEYGISVNGICPGTVWTPMMDGFARAYVSSGQGTLDEYRAFIAGLYPMGHIQTADDIASACSFLLEEGRGLQGQALLVSGGIVFS